MDRYHHPMDCLSGSSFCVLDTASLELNLETQVCALWNHSGLRNKATVVGLESETPPTQECFQPAYATSAASVEGS
jgi:hypothetical protein